VCFQENEVVKVMNMADDVFSEKRHVLVFRTEQGDLLLGTNNLTDVSEQEWFRLFLNVQSVRDVRVQQPPQQQEQQRFSPPQQQQAPQPAPQMRMPPRPQQQAPARQIPSSIMDVIPDNMTVDLWNEMTGEQQQQWLKKFNLQ
jgi:hypothetical protein